MASPTGRGLTGGRFQVHAQSGSGVDLDDGAALLLQRPADVHSHHIDAGDVQADGASRLDGTSGGFRMNAIRYIRCGAAGAEVAVAANQHALAGRRHRIRRVALLGQHGQADRIELDETQDRGMAVAAARIAVDLGDELRDGRTAIADDVGRLAAGGGDETTADDQQAIIVAGNVRFDEDAGAFLASGGVGVNDLLARS